MTGAGNDSWIESTNTQAIKEALIASALTKREQHQLNGLLRKLMLSFEASSAPTRGLKCSQPGSAHGPAVQ